MGKRRGDGRHPQGGQVTGGAEVPPESEAQFGEDLDAAARAAALLAGRSSLRFFDVAPLAGPASALEERPSAVPRLRPTPRIAVVAERLVDGVAEQDFKPPEIGQQRRSGKGVPVVKPDRGRNIAARRCQIGLEPLFGEPLNKGLLVRR